MADPVERVSLVFQAIPGGDLAVDAHGDLISSALQWSHVVSDPIADVRAGIEAVRGPSYGLASGSALGASVNFYAPRNAIVLEFDEHRGRPMDRREHRREALRLAASRRKGYRVVGVAREAGASGDVIEIDLAVGD